MEKIVSSEVPLPVQESLFPLERLRSLIYVSDFWKCLQRHLSPSCRLFTPRHPRTILPILFPVHETRCGPGRPATRLETMTFVAIPISSIYLQLHPQASSGTGGGDTRIVFNSSLLTGKSSLPSGLRFYSSLLDRPFFSPRPRTQIKASPTVLYFPEVFISARW